MLKTSSQLEVKIGERVYGFLFPHDAPVGELHDALFKMRSFVIDRINEMMKVDLPKEVKHEPEKQE